MVNNNNFTDELVIYTQPTCPQCRAIKMLMDKKGLKYTCCEDTEVMAKAGISHTPTLKVNDKLLAGAELTEYLKTR